MLICQNCGRVLKKWDEAYFLLEIPPHHTLTEINTFLKHNAVPYCVDCIEVLRAKTASQ
ncbi:hypothetical protein ACFP1L_07405 [Lactiplantibacillus nangangensis]|uniref:Fe3+ hydroxamate ABC transporter substrate-binding protein n=1 Tax=Lactiplantibacillus nangangensis TaxID=2559917 RepID=A0ABW1SK58_9LACO|nr:hypothetical protein [Lactiplantibacillus nangangensis]